MNKAFLKIVVFVLLVSTSPFVDFQCIFAAAPATGNTSALQQEYRDTIATMNNAQNAKDRANRDFNSGKISEEEANQKIQQAEESKQAAQAREAEISSQQ